MTLGGDANQTDDDAAQAGLDPGAGVPGVCRSGRLRQSGLEPAWTAPRSRRTPKASRRCEKSFQGRCRPGVEEKLDIVDTLQPTEGTAQGRRRLAEARLGRYDLRRAPQGDSPASQLGQKLLDETRSLTDELGKEVAGQVKAVTNKAKEAYRPFRRSHRLRGRS